MKNSLQFLFFQVVFIVLVLILPSCKKDKIPEQISNQIKSKMIVKKDTDTPKSGSRDCGKFVITAPSSDGILKFEKVITVPCYTLTIDPKWPFTPGGCTVCLKEIPNFKDWLTNAYETVIFPVNDRIVGIQYFVTSPYRTNQNFILRQGITLTTEMKQRFSTNRLVIPAGSYSSWYDQQRKLYIAFLPIQ